MLKNKVVIIVDDEFIILESLRIQLSRIMPADLQLELASSGEEAIALIDELYEDGQELMLVVSDFNIDSYKGTDILRHALQHYPNMKKIILTGQADTRLINEFNDEHGIDAIVEKPWDIQQIKPIIDSLSESYS